MEKYRIINVDCLKNRGKAIMFTQLYSDEDDLICEERWENAGNGWNWRMLMVGDKEDSMLEIVFHERENDPDFDQLLNILWRGGKGTEVEAHVKWNDTIFYV